MIDFKITFLLPTCEPDEMFKHLLPSIHRIEKSRDYINFAICFQPPYTDEEINKVLDELDKYKFNYKYFYKDYQVKKPYTPLIKMRNDCALLFPDSLVYGLLDDDMSFESEICVGDLFFILNQFIKDDNLGVVSCKPYDFADWHNNCFATDCGIFYRGGVSYGFKGLMPENLYQFKNIKNIISNYNNENLLELFGGYQDKFCANVRLLNGNKPLMITQCFVKHRTNRKIRGADGHGWKPAELLLGSISQFIQKYYCKNFLEEKSLALLNEDKLALVKNKPMYQFLFAAYEVTNKFLINKEAEQILIKFVSTNKGVEDYIAVTPFISYLGSIGFIDKFIKYEKDELDKTFAEIKEKELKKI